jgi:hypothetical protein
MGQPGANFRILGRAGDSSGGVPRPTVMLLLRRCKSCLPWAALMSVCRIVTWNVLHWVHARNHCEDLSTFPVEEQRARAVVERIARIDAEATCLQEVSGDTLMLIARTFGRERVHWLRLPRLPRLKVGESVLRDDSENLVVITTGVKLHARAFGNDGGKGFIAIRHASNTLIVCTHISGHPDKRPQQLKAIDKWINGQSGSAVLCGDFNVDARRTLESLRLGWHAARIRGALQVSRPKSNELIDHILRWSGTDLAFAKIEDAGGISDHNLVIADDLCNETVSDFGGRECG